MTVLFLKLKIRKVLLKYTLPHMIIYMTTSKIMSLKDSLKNKKRKYINSREE